MTQAPDWGVNGERRLPGRALTKLMDGDEEEVQIVTAPLRGTALFSLFDPRNLLTPERLQVIDAGPGSRAPRLRRLPAPDPAGDGALRLPQPRRLLDRAGGRPLRAAGDALQGGHVHRPLRTGAPAAAGQRLAGDPPEARGTPPTAGAGCHETAHRVAADMHGLNGERIEGLRAPRGAQRPSRRLPRALRGASRRRPGRPALARRHRDFADRARRAWALAAAAYREVEGDPLRRRAGRPLPAGGADPLRPLRRAPALRLRRPAAPGGGLLRSLPPRLRRPALPAPGLRAVDLAGGHPPRLRHPLPRDPGGRSRRGAAEPGAAGAGRGAAGARGGATLGGGAGLGGGRPGADAAPAVAHRSDLRHPGDAHLLGALLHIDPRLPAHQLDRRRSGGRVRRRPRAHAGVEDHGAGGLAPAARLVRRRSGSRRGPG